MQNEAKNCSGWWLFIKDGLDKVTKLKSTTKSGKVPQIKVATSQAIEKAMWGQWGNKKILL